MVTEAEPESGAPRAWLEWLEEFERVRQLAKRVGLPATNRHVHQYTGISEQGLTNILKHRNMPSAPSWVALEEYFFEQRALVYAELGLPPDTPAEQAIGARAEVRVRLIEDDELKSFVRRIVEEVLENGNPAAES